MKVGLTPVVRQLRRNATDVERKLCYQLCDRRFIGFKFIRGKCLAVPYVVDFLCVEAGLSWMAVNTWNSKESTMRSEPPSCNVKA